MNGEELYEHINFLITKNPYFRYLTKENREDVINQTWLNIWEKIESGELSNEFEKIKGFIFIACRNNTANILRESNKTTDIEPIEWSIVDDHDEYEEYPIEAKKQQIFNKLHDPLDREILRLRLEGKSVEKVGQEMGLTYNRIHYLNGLLVRRLSENFKKCRIKERKNLYLLIDVDTDEVVDQYVNFTKLGQRFGYSSSKMKRILKLNLPIQGKYKVKKVNRI